MGKASGCSWEGKGLAKRIMISSQINFEGLALEGKEFLSSGFKDSIFSALGNKKKDCKFRCSCFLQICPVLSFAVFDMGLASYILRRVYVALFVLSFRGFEFCLVNYAVYQLACTLQVVLQSATLSLILSRTHQRNVLIFLFHHFSFFL